MAGLIFFWQGGCIEYVPEAPVLPDVGYAPRDPAVVIDFVGRQPTTTTAFAARSPIAGVSFLPKLGSDIAYEERLQPPVCEHE